jgi:hypothetical protein
MLFGFYISFLLRYEHCAQTELCTCTISPIQIALNFVHPELSVSVMFWETGVNFFNTSLAVLLRSYSRTVKNVKTSEIDSFGIEREDRMEALLQLSLLLCH